MSSETKPEETKTEETKTEETKTEETKKEEVKTEEVKTEEKKTEEVKTEEVKTEEKKTEETKTEEVKTEEKKPEEEEKVTGKSEKKVRKAISKLGMVKIEGVNRVTMKQKDNYILCVKDPEVYSSPQNENTFIIFGELTFEDPEKKMSQEAIAQMKKEGDKLKTVTEKPVEQKVEVVPEEEGEVSEEGLDPEAIETVMNEGNCSRQQAIKALRAHNGDPVEALLEINH